jgi:hypothetical protein
MDVVYLVKGFVTPSAIEKVVFYNGKSAKKAFGYLEGYSEKAAMVVQIWEDGYFVREFEAK